MNCRDMIYEMMKESGYGTVIDTRSSNNFVMKATPTHPIPKVKKVIWNDKACVVIWADETKTIVKCQEGDVWNKEVGLMAAFSKKLFGNDNTFNKVINRHCSEFFNEDERIQKALEKLNKCIMKAYDGDVDKMKRVIYMNGQLTPVHMGFACIKYTLPEHAIKFMKLAKQHFQADLDAYNLKLSIIKMKGNGFKIVLVEQKGE